MTDKIYEQATKLRHSKEVLGEINYIMTYPYPEFNIFKPKFSFSYKLRDLNVDFVELDNETIKQLKEAILNVVKKRRQEIDEELEQL